MQEKLEKSFVTRAFKTYPFESKHPVIAFSKKTFEMQNIRAIEIFYQD